MVGRADQQPLLKSGRRPPRAFSFHATSLGILVLLPWLVFTTVLCLLTFAYHHFRSLVYLLVFIGLLLSLLFILIGTRHRKSGGGPIYLYLGFLSVFGVLMGSVVGLYAYHEFAVQFWAIEEGRAYTNVRPDDPALGHLDAGRLSFSLDARVDTQRTVGFRDKTGSIFCVAPIVGDQDLTTGEYFAAGEGCCDQRSDFDCDDSSDPKARGGIVLVDRSPFVSSSREKYLKAAKEAEGTYELKAGKYPIFIKWVRDAESVQDQYWNECLVFVLFASVVHLGVSAVFGSVLHFSSHMSSQIEVDINRPRN